MMTFITWRFWHPELDFSFIPSSCTTDSESLTALLVIATSLLSTIMSCRIQIAMCILTLLVSSVWMEKAVRTFLLKTESQHALSCCSLNKQTSGKSWYPPLPDMHNRDADGEFRWVMISEIEASLPLSLARQN